ncbi:hypothetical protein A3D72_00235 [Candidatus Uhrbacteria bacterium RIFCSPHIGHO2_02_FULL_57_19]|uniref:Uncharacterized protein n=1 Tax=Candidatus Uhrbacteria bacterium RIFCSPHIGHO2_02_FULL_57_19 TaxID=1802391 RepID=A0A1F7U6Q2_9BACT|nr:MAG: hypothetical protein A3D72_00235 [Candidatus Uhrbacteria bacterium RIFCSPHIGHO2_02_FULL_57_19]
MPHQFEFTLDLLRQAIDKAPNFFPEERRAALKAKFESLRSDPKSPREDIELAIIEAGREIWSYRKAFWRIHDTEGREKEEKMILERLSPATRARFDEFIRGGGKVQDVRKGGEFEKYFTPEQKFEIVEAKLSAHEEVIKDIETMCVGTQKSACETHLGDYRKEQEEIERLVAALRALAEKSEKWAPEILDKVRVFEEGWSGLEREVEKGDVLGEIDYYQGIIET